MKTVEPIRDKKKLSKMKEYLRANSERDYVMFILGINSGLRVSDILALKVADVTAPDGSVVKRISVKERKTGKTKDFPVADGVSKAIREHLKTADLPTDGWLFPSRKGHGRPITRIQAWRIINKAALVAGIDVSSSPIGTHSMRKTFGYHAYKSGVDLSLIQKLLNHSSPGVTLAYIGITREDLDNVYLNLNL